MYINPITPIQPMTSNFVSAIQALQPVLGAEDKAAVQEVQKESAGLSFADMLKKLIDDSLAASVQSKADAFDLSWGLMDDSDLHNIEINAIKADLALRSMVSVRNKVMEAYTEIMRINV